MSGFVDQLVVSMGDWAFEVYVENAGDGFVEQVASGVVELLLSVV